MILRNWFASPHARAACWWVSTIRPRWESCWIMKPTKFINLLFGNLSPVSDDKSACSNWRGFQVQTFAGAASTKTRCTISDIDFTLRSRQSRRTHNCNCRSMGSNFHSIFWVSEQVCSMQKGLPVLLAAGHGSDAARTFTLKSKLAYSFSRCFAFRCPFSQAVTWLLSDKSENICVKASVITTWQQQQSANRRCPFRIQSTFQPDCRWKYCETCINIIVFKPHFWLPPRLSISSSARGFRVKFAAESFSMNFPFNQMHKIIIIVHPRLCFAGIFYWHQPWRCFSARNQINSSLVLKLNQCE